MSLVEGANPSPEENEVLIRCEGFGLNFADVMAVKGLYRDAPPPPFIPGYEVVGRVERTGRQVPTELLGKRVVALTRFGGYAEFAVTDHRALAVIPEEIPLGEALALATQGCTAWYMSMIARPLRRGENVLVHSAAGGVGQLLVQLALHRGCTVFAVASGTAKLDHLKQLGAHHVIDRRAADYAAVIGGILGERRLHASFNAVGGNTFPKDMRLLASGGALVLFGGSERGGIGALGTLRFVWRMGVVVPVFLMMKCRSLIGVNLLRISEDRPEILAECLHGAVKAHADGWLAPRVHHIFDRHGLPDALTQLGAGGTIGKLAVRW